jgi:hypothetical protein
VVHKDPDAYYEEESIVEASPVSASQTPTAPTEQDLRYQRILNLYRTSSSKSSSRSIDDDFDDDFDDDDDEDDNDIITSKNNNIKTIQYRRVIDDDELSSY